MRETTVSYPDAWRASGHLNAIDCRFADLVLSLSSGNAPEVWLGAALASKAVQEGHVCLDLTTASEKPFADEEGDGAGVCVCPPWEEWRDVLRTSKAVGAPEDFTPLVLDEAGRLYLYRYWHYEKVVAEFLRARFVESAAVLDFSILRPGLDRLFPVSDEAGPDYQRVAAMMSACRRMAVITGGPGTGKTTTVVKILAFLLELEHDRRIRIALAAPTGKAAARLRESIKKAKEELRCTPEIISRIPEEASTLHRLLGSRPHSTRFRFDAENRLPFDVVAVDEASMIDLPLMAKLVQALPPACRLILLGDKDQLASVQPGAVFGDICGREPLSYSAEFCQMIEQGLRRRLEAGIVSSSSAQDSIVTLRKSYRFGASSGIGTVSALVNQGAAEAALEAMTSGRYGDIRWRDLPAPGALEKALEKTILAGYGPYLKESTLEAAFKAFGAFRILCALRQGPFGVAAVNQAALSILDREGLINAAELWFRGRPVLVTRNDYQLKLFNGDIGIAFPDTDAPGESAKSVFFPSEGRQLRKVLPMRLPENETVYAMTVHKSQGSEFDSVVIILPDNQSPVLTRELIYTGITRAKREVEIWGNRQVFMEAIGRRIARTSGLHDALWHGTPDRTGS